MNIIELNAVRLDAVGISAVALNATPAPLAHAHGEWYELLDSDSQHLYDVEGNELLSK